MRTDISTVGIDGGNQPRRVAAAATRFYAGEPLMRTPTYTTGAISVHTVTPVTDAKPRIATDNFEGIASVDAQITSPTNTAVIAHKTYVTVPIPGVTRIRGRAKTATGLVDNDTDLIAILGNVIDFDLTNAVYTFDCTAASNASAFSIVDGNTIKGTVDVTVDPRAMRTVVA